MKNKLLLALTLAVLTSSAFAQMSDADVCDEGDGNCDQHESREAEPLKDIYPYKPFATSEIDAHLAKIHEGQPYLGNIYEIDRRGLQRANTRFQPWGGSFWPVYQGGIASNYQNIDSDIFITTLFKNIRWQSNVSSYKKRVEKVHPKIYELDEKELAKLSPTEKYDILLGDTSFDLTNRVWDYTEKRGNQKNWGFLASIDIPDGYRIPDASKLMAFWEGICHGWALGAGYIPRPEHTISFTLPNGKRMPIYPSDMMALVSQVWANSDIQDNAIFEGNRCNQKNPDKDKFGRYIDTEIDKIAGDSTVVPRCADTHPAIFHVSVVNVMGVEGRPITYDHNAKMPIANQPMSGYEFSYFNPDSGKDGTLRESMIPRYKYAKDPYAENRNPQAVFIVGVQMNAKYTDWELPKKKETSKPSDDKIVDNKFMYDLEIDASGKIVGGQWRVNKKGKPEFLGKSSTNQPDYFWLAPRNYQQYFKPAAGLPAWSGRGLPPASFLAEAKKGHAYVRNMNSKLGGTKKCTVFPIDNKRLSPIDVDCEFNEPRPRPLINVVNKLIELSRE